MKNKKQTEKLAIEGEEYKTQNGWTEHYNGLGEVMAAAPDYYNAGKDAGRGFLRRIKKEFNNTPTVTSTRIIHNNSDAKIVHYYGSGVIKPVEQDIVIPVFSCDLNLEEALETKDGLAYLQKIFNTEDDAKTVKKTLERLSGYDAYEMLVCSKGKNDKKFELVINLAYLSNTDSFLIYRSLANYTRTIPGTNRLHGSGRSCRVVGE